MKPSSKKVPAWVMTRADIAADRKLMRTQLLPRLKQINAIALQFNGVLPRHIIRRSLQDLRKQLHASV